MFFNNEEFNYIKIPKSMTIALSKAIIQSAISFKFDRRSDPNRVAMSEFILLQFLNELNNSEYLENSKVEQLDIVFNGIEQLEKKEINED